ncbi:MAG: hypothetical protein ACKOOH_09865 [Cyanobium sp.]
MAIDRGLQLGPGRQAEGIPQHAREVRWPLLVSVTVVVMGRL